MISGSSSHADCTCHVKEATNKVCMAIDPIFGIFLTQMMRNNSNSTQCSVGRNHKKFDWLSFD